MRKTTTVIGTLAIVALLSAPALAQMQMPGGQPAQMPMQMDPGAGPAGAAAGIKGEITAIDGPNGRISIRHEPIAALNMRGMNMVFRLAEPGLATGLAVGDKVVFSAERKESVVTVTKLEKAPN